MKKYIQGEAYERLFGKILHVCLDSAKFEVEKPDENFYRRWIGNGIMGAYYLLKKTKPGIERAFKG